MRSVPHAPQPRLFALGWPLYLELWLGIGVGLVGTALAARQSDTSGAAFALANQVSATLFILFRLIGAGVSVVVTQRLGGQQREAADAVARAALGASTWLGGLSAAAALLGAGLLLRWMNTPAEVLPLAKPFLQALALSMLLDAWNAAMASVMRAHLHSRDTLLVILAMHGSHLLLTVPLMGGWGPLPAWGLPGFAVALILSRVLGVALHLWLWRLRLGLVPRRQDFWRLPRPELAALLHIGLPGAAENIVWRLCYMVSVAAAAGLGAAAMATHAYVSQIMNGVLLFGAATGLAVEIVVGHQIGAGRLHDAHQLVRRALGRGLLVTLAVVFGVALAGPWLIGWFSQDPAVVHMGAVLLWWTVLLEPGRTFNLVVINALRAAGDARYPVMAGAASMVLVLAGGSWWLGIHCGWGLPGLWVAYTADEWIRGLLMWRRWTRLAWVPHARATHRRLRAARVAA